MAKSKNNHSFLVRTKTGAKDTYANSKTKIKSFKLGDRIRKHPYVSFIATLVLLFLVIALGSFLTQPEKEEAVTEQAKTVAVYSLNGGSEITTQVRVQKTGVIKIFAQAPGIVQAVNVKEGETVQRGQSIANLSTNYQGGNAQGVQAQIAGTQYKNTVETFDTQKDLINKQREVANLSNSNTDQLREISEKSVGETRDLLNLNQNILDTINTNLTNLENNNPGGINDAAILQTKQVKSQVQAGVNQLNSTLRTLDYQTNSENDPTKLSNLSKDITLKQLDLQEKSLEVGKKVAGLQLSLAQIQASLMSPASPSNGVVQKVNVVFGQSVNPGTLIATIAQPEHEIIATAFVPQNIAPLVSQSTTSSITLSDGTVVKVTPRFISAEATDGQLYSVLYAIPQEYEKKLTDQEFLSISIPVSQIETSTTNLIPVDAVYQSENGASIFVVENNKAVEKQIKIGQIIGAYIEVLEGITENTQIILDRTVFSGQEVKINNS